MKSSLQEPILRGAILVTSLAAWPCLTVPRMGRTAPLVMCADQICCVRHIKLDVHDGSWSEGPVLADPCSHAARAVSVKHVQQRQSVLANPHHQAVYASAG